MVIKVGFCSKNMVKDMNSMVATEYIPSVLGGDCTCMDGKCCYQRDIEELAVAALKANSDMAALRETWGKLGDVSHTRGAKDIADISRAEGDTIVEAKNETT